MPPILDTVPAVVVAIRDLQVGDKLTIYGITCIVATAPRCIGKGAAGRIWSFDAHAETSIEDRPFTALEHKRYKVTRAD